MYKKLIFGLFVSISMLMASNIIEQEPELIKQEEVDLSVFQNLEVLKFAVTELSEGVPKKIDNYTTLVDVTSKDLTLIYIYEIDTGVKSDSAVRKEDQSRMYEAIKHGTCQSSKRFLDSGISITYIYNSKLSKEKLFQFDISKEDCIFLR